MATWQYDLHLIPRAKLIELFSTLPNRLDRDTFDQIEWWENEGRTIQDAELRLGTFLRPRSSWTERIKYWGKDDGDCVSVFVEGNRIAEIGVRINIQKLDSDFVENVCKFSKLYQCLLLTEQLRLIEPDRDSLLEEIANSDASAFVLDPTAYLNRQK